MHWQIGRLVSLEDAIGICRRLSEQVGKIDAVGHQSAVGGGGTQCMDRRQPVARESLAAEPAPARLSESQQAAVERILAGGGPYLLTAYEPNKRMVLEANPTYYGKQPA